MVTAVQAKSLRMQLASAGVYQHHDWATFGKIIILTMVLSAALVAMVALGAIAWPLAVPAAAVCCTTMAMIGHEGVHKSFSASPMANWAVAFFTFPFFAGLSALYWKDKHDGKHHGHPNVEGEDPDIELWPMTSSQEAHQQSGAFRRWFQRNLQGYAFWPLTLLLGMMMRISSVKHLFNLAVTGRRTRLFWIDTACVASHYTLWLVVPALVWGPLAAFLAYALIWGLVGVFLAAIFAPAHMGLPVVRGQNNDWIHQLETTRNLVLPRWLSWFFIGLDYQVEHHLFPKIPHQGLPKAAVIVKAWCEEHGFPHQSIHYGPALVDVTRFLHNAWKTPSVSGDDMRAAYQARITPAAPIASADFAGLLPPSAPTATAPSMPA